MIGLVIVSYSNVALLDEGGKKIGSSGIERLTTENGKGQRVLLKRKDVYFQEGHSIKLGNKHVDVGVSTHA